MKEDIPSKNILEFYMGANRNKEKVSSSITKDGQTIEYSVAEEVVLACINELLVGREDRNQRIRHIILKSLYGRMNGIQKRIEYENFIMDNKMEVESISSINFTRSLGTYKQSDKAFELFKKLHDTTRQGHIYWGAKGKRLESILEHIYGCLILTIGIESEYDFSLDYDKILAMLLLHETEEIIIGDETEWDITPEEKKRRGKEAVEQVLSGLTNSKELHEIIDEFEEGITLESKYARLCDKLEYDMQVKVYELEGRYDFKHYPQNVVTQSASVQEIIQNGASSVFEVHYEYDKGRYDSIPSFRRILEATKKYKN